MTKVAWVAIGLAILTFIVGVAGGFSLLTFLMFLGALVLSIVALAQRGGKKALPAIALPLSVVALFVGIGVSVSDSTDDEPATTVVAEPTSDQKAESGTAAEPTKPALTFPGSTEDDFIAKGGATIERQGVKVTASKLKHGDDTFGNTLCVSVSYVNDSDDEISFNPYDWKLQDSDGKIVDVSFGGSDHALDSADLAPGGKAKGDVCFESSAKPKGTYIVLWDATFRLSSDRLAWINTI